MIRRPPRSTLSSSSAASDVYKRQVSKEFVDLKKLSGKYEFKIFSDPFLDEAEAIEQIADFEALLIMRERTPITKNLIDNLNDLKYIITSGSRNKAIDLEAAKKRKIIVCGTEINSVSYTHLTLPTKRIV